MSLLVAILLTQTCGVDMSCMNGGFVSHAALTYGSGFPDFQCGEADDLPDGGWGFGTRYCLLETHMSGGYDQSHGDFTLGNSEPRTAGYRFFIHNSYFAGPVFWVRWNGDTWAYGNIELSTNGTGVRQTASYLPMYGVSPNANLIPDTILASGSPHANGGYVAGVFNGTYYPIAFRDDSYISTNNITFKVDDSGDGIRFTKELPDGGVLRATLQWSP